MSETKSNGRKPDFFKIIEGCGSIHDQVDQLDKWYGQENEELQKRAERLEKENQKLKAALEKIATTEYLTYRQGETPADHQYKLGVTDGHRLAAQWAKEALK